MRTHVSLLIVLLLFSGVIAACSDSEDESATSSEEAATTVADEDDDDESESDAAADSDDATEEADEADSSESETPAEDESTETEEWSYTSSGYDLTVTLDAPPEDIVLDAYSTQAMWPYGIRPVGIWGYGQDEDSMQGVDTSEFETIGVDGEFSLETLSALDPDIIIGYGNEDGTGWTWWDEQTTEAVSDVAPYLPFAFSVEYNTDGDSPAIEQVIEEYERLALALGGELNDDVAAAKEDFQTAKTRLEEVLNARDDLSIAFVASTGDAIWHGTESLAVGSLLLDLGLNRVGPEDDGPWAEGAWEEFPALQADVVLELTVTPEDVRERDLYQANPAVQAGQVYDWNDKYPMTYRRFADWMSNLADQLETAEDIL